MLYSIVYNATLHIFVAFLNRLHSSKYMYVSCLCANPCDFTSLRMDFFCHSLKDVTFWLAMETLQYMLYY